MKFQKKTIISFAILAFVLTSTFGLISINSATGVALGGTTGITVTVSGTVKDGLGNKVIGASVRAGSGITTTNSQGSYTVTGTITMYAMTFDGKISFPVTASKSGYGTRSTTVVVDGSGTALPGDEPIAPIRRSQDPIKTLAAVSSTVSGVIITIYRITTVSGHITDGTHNVAGATVKFYFPGGYKTVTTDNYGYYTVSKDAPPSSYYRVDASKSGFISSSSGNFYSAGGSHTKNIILGNPDPVTIYGYVSRSGEGNKLYGVIVTATCNGQSSQDITDQNGHYSLDIAIGTGTKTVSLQYTRYNYETVTTSISATAGGFYRKDISLVKIIVSESGYEMGFKKEYKEDGIWIGIRPFDTYVKFWEENVLWFNMDKETGDEMILSGSVATVIASSIAVILGCYGVTAPAGAALSIASIIASLYLLKLSDVSANRYTYDHDYKFGIGAQIVSYPSIRLWFDNGNDGGRDGTDIIPIPDPAITSLAPALYTAFAPVSSSWQEL